MPIPEIDDKFNAYTKQYGNLARHAPFECTKTDEVNKTVKAIDSQGETRRFAWIHRNQPPDCLQDWTFTFEVIQPSQDAIEI